MKKGILFAAVVTASVYSAIAQNLLKPKWKFKTGDDVSWARIEHDDSDWKEIKAGEFWELQGFDPYDGFAWYRMTIFIPSSYKKEAEKSGGFLLNLGKVDDADYLYLNGQQIAQTGEFPPHYLSKYDVIRKYEIPANKILWDKENVIAIRVYDSAGGGGIYGDPIDLRVKGMEDNIKIDVVFDRPDRIFIDKKEFAFTITVSSNLMTTIKGKVKVTVKSDFKDSIATLVQNVEMGKNTVKTLKFTLKDLKPGFYDCDATLESAIAMKNMKFSFGVDPEKIVSPLDRMADFENYWDRAKKELACVDPQYKLSIVDSMSKGTRNVYVLEMRSLGNVLVRAWYAVPKKAGKYPAILHLQGYSSFMKMDWAYTGDDMVVLALNIRGHGFSKDNVDPGFPGYLQYFVNDKEQYIYRGAYMDTRRAIDFLVSRQEVDASKIVVEGGSQGGALSFAAAALNNERVALCVPHVPFLSDFRDYVLVGNWPANEFKTYIAKHPEVGENKVFETLSYIDIKNLAPWVKCPTLMAIGLVDNVCPPHINFAAYNQLNVPKEYIVYPISGHGIPQEYHKLKYEWIKKKLGMK
jgi:cephalosporin-C deacetylase